MTCFYINGFNLIWNGYRRRTHVLYENVAYINYVYYVIIMNEWMYLLYILCWHVSEMLHTLKNWGVEKKKKKMWLIFGEIKNEFMMFIRNIIKSTTTTRGGINYGYT